MFDVGRSMFDVRLLNSSLLSDCPAIALVTAGVQLCPILLARFLLAAKQGDREALEEIVEGLAKEIDIDSNFFAPLFYAWAGNREDANRIAARFDSHPWGPWVLWQTANWCACGDAFDLEATPNFARMINDSDVNWPPHSGREYPLKDW